MGLRVAKVIRSNSWVSIVFSMKIESHDILQQKILVESLVITK